MEKGQLQNRRKHIWTEVAAVWQDISACVAKLTVKVHRVPKSLALQQCKRSKRSIATMSRWIRLPRLKFHRYTRKGLF